VEKITDILVQLLQTVDVHEQQMVQNSLMKLLNQPKRTRGTPPFRPHIAQSNLADTLAMLLSHVAQTDDKVVRDRALRFLVAKVRTLDTKILTKEIEEFLFDEAKKILNDVNDDEFILFMSMLQKLSHLQNVNGRKELLALVVKQKKLRKTLDVCSV
jgi:predicted house-cleaning noncanonical NTP pyrophosphatase (MazG superfamily)